MSSRKEEKERLRQERLEREAAAAAAAGKRKRLGLIVAGIVAVAAIAAVIAVGLGGGDDGGGGSGDKDGGNESSLFPETEVPARKIRDLEEAAEAAGCVLSEPKNEGAEHVETKVKYKSNPPTSGNHNPTPAGDGVKEEPAEAEALVHSLEHGRVIFQFSEDAPPRVRGALKAVFDEDSAIAILTQNTTNMPFQVAATAWDKLMACRTYNDKVPDALRAFREENRLKGPEFVPNPE